MLTCRQVSKTLAENRYYELPWHRKLGLFLHIRLCFVCGKANRQIIVLQSGIRKFLAREEKEHFTEIRLKPEERERIRNRMNDKL